MAPTLWRWIFVAPWLLFGGWWLLRAFSTARTVRSEPPRQRLLLLALTAAGALFLAVPPLPLRAPLWPTPLPLLIVALAFEVAGVAFAIVAREYLGTMWSGRVTLKEDHRIVQTGPYRLVRHPIYTGILTGLVGLVLVRANAGAILGFVLSALAVARKVAAEEELLRGHFGAAYDEYRHKVAAIIPFIL